MAAAPPPLHLFNEEADGDLPVRRAIALLLGVCSLLRLHHTVKYSALALLVDRSLPTLEAAAASGQGHESPPLAPLVLAVVLLSSKLHETQGLLISELRAATLKIAPEVHARLTAKEVVDAEIWLVTKVNTGVLRPLSDTIFSLLTQLQLSQGSGAPRISFSECTLILDLLSERLACRGWLTSGGRGLAAAVITAAAVFSVPPCQRAGAAPWLAWLACGESLDDVQRAAELIVHLCITAVSEDEA